MNKTEKLRGPLSPEEIFADSDTFAYPTVLGNSIVYLTNLAEDGGRSVLVLVNNSEEKILTPNGFEVRTRINEYGGKPFWISEQTIYFCNNSDQCLYAQTVAEGEVSPPSRVSPLPSDEVAYRYSDVHEIGLGRPLLVAIIERVDKVLDDKENECFIGSLDLENPQSPPVPIVRGADFYCNLVIDGSLNRIAWVEWNHPNMPWDENRACIAKLESDGSISSQREIDSDHIGQNASLCQLLFTKSGNLLLSADYQDSTDSLDFWNIHIFDEQQNSLSKVTHETVEFGYPHWQYGDARIVQLDDTTVATVGSTPMGDKLYLIDLTTLNYHVAYSRNSTIMHLDSDGKGNLYAVELGFDRRAEIVKFSANGTQLHRKILVDSMPLDFEVCKPVQLKYDTQNSGKSYGFYYSPSINDGEAEPSVDGPRPLIVMVHGGPTARSYGHFDLQKQFWLSNGFAVFDVNHRGSSGFGRNFRDSLYGHWGQKDIADIVNGIKHLVASGKVDRNRVVIRGKSAGGYAVLRALTEYPDAFQAGACYYGIGNLATLAETTHKFEKHYTDRLVGEPYSPNCIANSSSAYFLRSPSKFMHKVDSSMIVFQGGEDKIVPVKVAEEIVQELKNNGVKYDYVLYPDEGHGFRSAANNIDALGRELAFYKLTLGL